MKKPGSIKELAELFWFFENKYGLLDYDFDGVKVWQAYRMSLFYKIAEESGVLAKPHSDLSRIEKIKHRAFSILSSLTNNYFTLKEKEIVVCSHPRAVYIDEEYIDIYTKYYIDELVIKGLDLIEFEVPYQGIYRKSKNNLSHRIGWILVAQKLYKLFVKPQISVEQKQLINEINNKIKSTCEIDFDLLFFMKSHIKSYKSMYWVYRQAFKKVKPKALVTVVAYFQAPMIKAAKDLGIEVIELQHGTISKFHLGYSFPDRLKVLDYFPDKIYVWNKFWKEVINYPLSECDIVVDRFRYQEYQVQKFKHLSKVDNQLLVLSQGSIGNEIADKILVNWDFFKDYNIKYKLHPGEFNRWRKYPSLIKLSKQSNVEIILDQIDLYKLFATSKVQVGVYSTALYEGLEFDCITILLNIKGIEYMTEFIKANSPKII